MKAPHPQDWYVVSTCNAGLFPASWVISRRDLCAGRGQKMARRSQLSVTVSALNVCLSISIPWFHLDGAEFRARWLVLKVIFGSTCPQTITWETKIRRRLKDPLCGCLSFVRFATWIIRLHGVWEGSLCVIKLRVGVYENVFLPRSFYKSVFLTLGWLNVDKIRADGKSAVLFVHTDMAFFNIITSESTLVWLVTFSTCF